MACLNLETGNFFSDLYSSSSINQTRSDGVVTVANPTTGTNSGITISRIGTVESYFPKPDNESWEYLILPNHNVLVIKKQIELTRMVVLYYFTDELQIQTQILSTINCIHDTRCYSHRRVVLKKSQIGH